MSTTTPINGFQIPQLGDAPNIETAIHPFANAIDTNVVARFSSAAARDAAITSPTFGQMCAVSGTGELYFYNGTSWVGARPRFFRKNADETVNNSATLQNDNDLNFSVEANSRYIAKYHLFLFGSNVFNDMKFNWLLPAGAGKRSYGITLDSAATTNLGSVFMAWQDGLDQASAVHTTGPAALLTGSFHTSSTPGTATLQWAMLSADANTVSIAAHSFLEVLKVD